MNPPQDEALPRAEDVECLCKLLTTVGGKLDATTKDEFRNRMKVYFERMKRLTENPALESRIRFMVQVRTREMEGAGGGSLALARVC